MCKTGTVQLSEGMEGEGKGWGDGSLSLPWVCGLVALLADIYCTKSLHHTPRVGFHLKVLSRKKKKN